MKGLGWQDWALVLVAALPGWILLAAWLVFVMRFTAQLLE